MKILIVKTSSLGDIIHTFGAVDYLKNRFPHAQIDWVVELPFAELVKAHPHIDRVMAIESKKWRRSPFKQGHYQQVRAFRKQLREIHYDLLFDLQGNLKSGLITSFSRAKEKIGFGWRSLPEWPNGLFTTSKINPPEGKNIREDYLALIQRFFRDEAPYTVRPFSLKLDPIQLQKLETLMPTGELPTLVCPSSAWPNKCLEEKTLVKVLRRLKQDPYWFVWGSPAEREIALRLSSFFPGSSVLERLSLPLLQHVMGRCKLVVAMDSLPLHLCGTTTTPSLSFFGPSSALKYRPLGDRHRAIQGDCPYGITFEKRCPKLRTCATGSCLKVAENVEGRAEAAVGACLKLNSG